MVLATIIRLEMAYPGVGILAGDNAQYLSIVTAHGVIMVFFMAMPMLFGFFGNFLLPTQMGVHDVAFPRMNSAAFWFLPASLLALCQLVCVDRRYQRMNCFNIRELQGLLRNRFFEELTPALLLNNQGNPRTLKNLRSFNLAYPAEPEYVTFGLSGLVDAVFNPFLGSPNRSVRATSAKYGSGGVFSRLFNWIVCFTSRPLWAPIAHLRDCVVGMFSALVGCFRFVWFTLSSLFGCARPASFFASFFVFFDLSWLNHVFTAPVTLNYHLMTKRGLPNTHPTNPYKRAFTYTNPTQFLELTPELVPTGPFSVNTVFSSSLVNSREARYENPEILYKIKTGNYLPDELARANFASLLTSLNFKSISGIKASWWDSKNLSSLLDGAARNSTTPSYFAFISMLRNGRTAATLNTNQLTETLISQNLRSLLFAQAKQVRVLNNWRSLKLTREG